MHSVPNPRRFTTALLTRALVGVTAQARAVDTTPLEITLSPHRNRRAGGTLRRHGGRRPRPGALADAPALPAGLAVTVDGRFVTMRRLGAQTLTNVIEAFPVRCR